jgi:transposase
MISISSLWRVGSILLVFAVVGCSNAQRSDSGGATAAPSATAAASATAGGSATVRVGFESLAKPNRQGPKRCLARRTLVRRIVAMRHNPLLRAFAERLRARGKSNTSIVVAVMRKLLTMAYGVLESGRPFDPAYAAS